VLIAHQPVRILGKYEMVKVPVFGWIYRAAVILVDRRDSETRSRSVRALKSALKHHISIFIFPEGTFNETPAPLKEFYDGAFRIAIETKSPIKPILLVYTVEGLTLKDIQWLKQKVYTLMENGLKRYRSYPAA
jgi:1-acyl-sn-glycerol-3-phosphate acyltransferase